MIFTATNKKAEVDSVHPLLLFKKYCPSVNTDSNCRSPLRVGDNLPSFRLFYSNNALLFNDFGLGETGDIYKFVRILFGLTYAQAIDKLYRDIKNIPDEIKTKPIFIPEDTVSKSEILYDYRKVKTEDNVFWSKILNELKTLNLFDVYPISRFKVKDYIFNCKNLTYVFHVGSRLKIYQPGNTIKYMGNTNSNSIQGWQMLNFDIKKLYLVSSLKEVIVLYEQGVQAIAPNSESTLISPKVMNFLKFYWDIEILYDWDKAGLINARKHSVKYNLPISKLQFKKMKTKDLSDFREIYGFSNLSNILL